MPSHYLNDRGREAQLEHEAEMERLARELPKNETATNPNARGHVPGPVQQAREAIAKRMGVNGTAVEIGLWRDGFPQEVTITEDPEEVERQPHASGHGHVVTYDDGSIYHEYPVYERDWFTERYETTLRRKRLRGPDPDDDDDD